MKFWQTFWPVVIVVTIFFSVAAFAQDRQSIEKNLPDDFYGEWCFAEPDNRATRHMRSKMKSDPEANSSAGSTRLTSNAATVIMLIVKFRTPLERLSICVRRVQTVKKSAPF